MVSRSEIEARFFMSASIVGALKQRTIGWCSAKVLVTHEN
jgi:hypothetical protein